jgi:hypothetical protein
MKAGIKALLVRTSTTAAGALLALALGGAPSVRAADSESFSARNQEMVQVSAKSLEAMEKRIAYLEETINSLTESWQHINTHRLCVADESGSETCVTKAQLDALLANQPRAEKAAPLTAVVEDAGKPQQGEPIAAATAPEPTPAAAAAEGPDTPVGAVLNEAPQADQPQRGEPIPAATPPVPTHAAAAAEGPEAIGAALNEAPRGEPIPAAAAPEPTPAAAAAEGPDTSVGAVLNEAPQADPDHTIPAAATQRAVLPLPQIDAPGDLP